MKRNKLYQLIFSSFILLVVLACNALVPVPAATSSPVPPSATSTPASPSFVISTFPLNETGQNPEYTVNAQIPTILENSDSRALAFNDQMLAIVQGEVDAFKLNISELPTDPNFAPSSFDVKYNVLLQNGELASIKFDVSGYTSGAAHPYHYTITINYDFEQGRHLLLDELFLPGSNYLEIISNDCIAQLSQRDIGFDMFSEGAAPTPENYRNWNITYEGLMITFDEYQVAPYAAGPQTVLLPYGELQTVVSPQGPLGRFIR